MIYVARQLGHDARLTLSTSAHVMDELEEAPRAKRCATRTPPLTELAAATPKIVRARSGQVARQFVILGASFMTVGLIIDLLVGIASGRLGGRLARSTRTARALDRIAGVVFVGLAARLATERSANAVA